MSGCDVVIIGAGHNGLVAACYLAKAGLRVQVLEATDRIGGAAISARVFDGVDARLSKYSYLVSLLPEKIQTDLELDIPTIKRRISSYTPDPSDPSRGVVLPDQVTPEWQAFYERITRFAGPLFDTLTRPLMSRADVQALINDDQAWQDFFERPLGEVIERTFADDVLRGIVLTDGLIGTFADAHDPSLHQNICFLYHVIGRGTGDWDVPVGGMGAVTGALADRARSLGVDIRCNTPVLGVSSSTAGCDVTTSDGVLHATWVLANCAPATLDELLGRPTEPLTEPLDGGAQIKVNMLLTRLPKLKDESIDPNDAFNGTFHINESYTQLAEAYRMASAGSLPDPIPAEIYCHSLTDPTILSTELREAGAQTLTVFALHTPHRLFTSGVTREQALDGVVRSLNSVLAEPIEDLLWRDEHGQACIEVNTTVDIAAALNIPTGNIFHTPLDWPFALSADEVGSWGVETSVPGVLLCGSGARRGGGVSGIPGHNAAQHVLERVTSTAK
jgi:phytoene dehydrogenase-like protein